MKSISMRSNRYDKWLSFLAALVFCIGGLASTVIWAQDASPKSGNQGKIIPLLQKDREAIVKYLGQDSIGQPVEAPVIGNPALIFGLRSGSWHGKINSGKKTGQDFKWSVAPSKGPEASAGWRGYRGDRQVDYIEQSDDGDVISSGVIDNEHGVITCYAPPEPRIKKGIKPGESHKVDMNVKVYSAKNPERLKYSGKLNLSYTYVGAYKIKVPAGQFDALLFKWEYKGKVGPAKIDDAVYRFFVPGVGPVAFIEFKHISAALIYHDTEKYGIVLTEYK